MNFALKENEPFSTASKRIAIEQLDLALHHLRAPAVDRDQAIHTTRQCLKRVRALLALVRDELGEKIFKREWTCYRDVGRLLAEGRDAAVVVEALDALVGHFSPELAGDDFAAERRFLVDRREARLRMMIEQESALKRAAEILTEARLRVASWPVKRANCKAIREGVNRSYRAGRQGLQTIARNPSLTNFHEWRKPVKLLWYQMQILTPIWPGVVKAHAEELHVLSDRLNENHDLDILLQAVLRSEVDTPSHKRQALASFVDRRCRQLEAEGRQLGERLYCERPRFFADRLKNYWQVWERGSVPVQGALADDYMEHREAARCAVRVVG